MNSGGIFDYPAKARKLNEVNAALEDPKVWDNPKRAQELGREKKSLEDVVLILDRLEQELSDNTELFEMSKDDNDEAGMRAIEGEAAKVAAEVEKMEFRRMFNNPADPLQLLPRHPGRRRRHRSLRLGQHAAAPVPEVRRAQGLQDHD